MVNPRGSRRHGAGRRPQQHRKQENSPKKVIPLSPAEKKKRLREKLFKNVDTKAIEAMVDEYVLKVFTGAIVSYMAKFKFLSREGAIKYFIRNYSRDILSQIAKEWLDIVIADHEASRPKSATGSTPPLASTSAKVSTSSETATPPQASTSSETATPPKASKSSETATPPKASTSSASGTPSKSEEPFTSKEPFLSDEPFSSEEPSSSDEPSTPEETYTPRETYGTGIPRIFKLGDKNSFFGNIEESTTFTKPVTQLDKEQQFEIKYMRYHFDKFIVDRMAECFRVELLRRTFRAEKVVVGVVIAATVSFCSFLAMYYDDIFY